MEEKRFTTVESAVEFLIKHYSIADVMALIRAVSDEGLINEADDLASELEFVESYGKFM